MEGLRIPFQPVFKKPPKVRLTTCAYRSAWLQPQAAGAL
jgi:hypothetical protein